MRKIYASNPGTCQALLDDGKFSLTLAVLSCPDTLEGMNQTHPQTFDDRTARCLDKALFDAQCNESDLARALGVTRQAVNDYINRKTKRWPVDRLRQAELFLKKPILPDGLSEVRQGSSAGQIEKGPLQSQGSSYRSIPVVDARAWPKSARGQLMEVIRKSAVGQNSVSLYNVPDKNLFYYRLASGFGQFGAGDMLLISMDRHPVDGSHILIYMGEKPEPARLMQLSPEVSYAVLSDGRRIPHPDIIGTAINVIVDLVRLTPSPI